MPAIHFVPKNRLAGVLGGPADATIEELARRADERVAALKPQIRAGVRALAARVAELMAADETVVFAECRSIRNDALAICEVAAAADLQAVGDAARGVHALVDALFTQGVWHTEALKLHVESLAVLVGEPAPDPEAARQMLARLKGMREWLGVAD